MKQYNWLGLNHKVVNERFGGDLTYLNDICVNGEYQPSAVYIAANPDRSKGHKTYMLLTMTNGPDDTRGMVVRGMEYDQIKKFRYQDAVKCLGCRDIIFSVNRHHYNACKCGSVTIDGGKDYTKIGFKDKAAYKMLKINLLTNKIVKKRKQKCL